jgi:hypothetical protein
MHQVIYKNNVSSVKMHQVSEIAPTPSLHGERSEERFSESY